MAGSWTWASCSLCKLHHLHPVNLHLSVPRLTVLSSSLRALCGSASHRTLLGCYAIMQAAGASAPFSSAACRYRPAQASFRDSGHSPGSLSWSCADLCSSLLASAQLLAGQLDTSLTYVGITDLGPAQTRPSSELARHGAGKCVQCVSCYQNISLSGACRLRPALRVYVCGCSWMRAWTS